MINKRFKEIRKNLNLNQKEFGMLLGISQNHVSTLESGTRKITDRIISELESYLNINNVWLKTGIGDMYCKSIKKDKFKNEATSVNKELLLNVLKLSKIDRNYLKAINKYMELSISK